MTSMLCCHRQDRFEGRGGCRSPTREVFFLNDTFSPGLLIAGNATGNFVSAKNDSKSNDCILFLCTSPLFGVVSSCHVHILNKFLNFRPWMGAGYISLIMSIVQSYLWALVQLNNHSEELFFFLFFWSVTLTSEPWYFHCHLTQKSFL